MDMEKTNIIVEGVLLFMFLFFLIVAGMTLPDSWNAIEPAPRPLPVITAPPATTEFPATTIEI